MSSTDIILSQNCFLQVQRGITKKNTYSRVMVVVLYTSSYDAYGNTCMKFYVHICPVWSEFSLSAWRNLGSLATHWVHRDFDQTLLGAHAVLLVLPEAAYLLTILHSNLLRYTSTVTAFWNWDTNKVDIWWWYFSSIFNKNTLGIH